MEPKAFQDLLLELRNRHGGLILALIIDPSLENLLPITKEEIKLDNFYLLGWYDRFKFPVYIDTSLTDEFYFIGNDKISKVKVNG